MNSCDIHDYKLHLVFENCECIDVDVGAIESFYMTTRGKRFTFDKISKRLLEDVEVDALELKLNMSDASNFYHSSQNQMLSLGIESVLTDRKNCVERIKTSTDISHIYINGVCYQMPWSPEKQYDNMFQKITKECTNGKNFITISIKSDKVINEL